MSTIDIPLSTALHDLRESPWNGPARDEKAQDWREKVDLMVRSIRANLGKKTKALNREEFDELLESLKGAADVLYDEQDDPSDRQALMHWLGVAYAVSDQCSAGRDGGGTGSDLTHMFVGKIMKYWAGAAWQDFATPEWAKEIYRGLDVKKHGYGALLSAATAVADLEIFLAAYHRQTNTSSSRNPRYSHFPWNKDALNACCAWTILAVEVPRMVPDGLINDLVGFQTNFVGEIPYLDIRRRALAAWEQKELTEFTDQIEDASGTLSAIQPGRIRTL